MATSAVTLSKPAVESVRRGHPWVWRRAITDADARLKTGAEVSLADGTGRRLGRGIWDPDSPIAVRVWTTEDLPVDDELVASRFAHALALRSRLFADGATTAYRLLHGEGDRTPGFVVDRYGDVAVLRTDGAAAEELAPRFARVVEPALREAGITSFVWRRATRRDKAAAAETLFGPDPPPTVTVTEHAIPFVVDLVRGQKTGAFLDQRENRRRVGRFARDRRVLNLHSHAGGFALHAARGGALSVTSVDVAAAGHATAQASFHAAGVPLDRHEFVTADALAFLAEAKNRGTSWDLIVSDPPSFAPNERSLPRALAAYRGLHRACADVLAPGGIFCASSCSSHVDALAFTGALDDAALGRRDLRLLSFHGTPADHPTLPAWPEGRYLKFAVLG